MENQNPNVAQKIEPTVECWPCGTPKRAKASSTTPIQNIAAPSVVSNPNPSSAVRPLTPCQARLAAAALEEWNKSPSSANENVPSCKNEKNDDRHDSNLINRRTMLIGTGVTIASVAAGLVYRERSALRGNVFIAKNQRYDGPLVQTIRDGLLASGVMPNEIRGKRILLKPNMVEPSRAVSHMTTHPAMVVATAEVFRQWGAIVSVGEGPGHVRDTEMALYESRIGAALESEHIPFADLNYQETSWVKNGGKTCKLDGFYFPSSVVEADLIVSMPKLKTHHWMGMTCAMKNLYGTVPGCRYGWPKNVLHYNGIPQTVFDINASLPNTITVVDGITCMEGDGPIMGSPKEMGLILIGRNPTAVDATAARIIGLRPERISYLQLADNRLGPIADRCIEQRGEAWEPLVNPFFILDEPHLRSLRDKPTALVT